MAMEGLRSELFVGFDDLRFCLAVWTFGISRGSKFITVEPRLEHLEPLLELNDARRSIVVPWSELLESVLSSSFKLFVVECVGEPNWLGTQRLSFRSLFWWKLFSDESFLLGFFMKTEHLKTLGVGWYPISTKKFFFQVKRYSDRVLSSDSEYTP